MNKFEKCLEKVNIDNNEVMIMGDFNVNLNVCDSKQEKLQDIMDAFCLEQLIEEPTRVTKKSSTLIDHVYVSAPHKILSSGVLKLSLSDHFAVWAVHHNKCPVENKNKSHKVIEFRKMTNFNIQEFTQDLKQVPWHNVVMYNDPNEALELWYEMFLETLDRHAPKKKKRVKSWQQPEWMTPEVLEAIKLRQVYKKKKMFEKYKFQRQIVKNVVKKAKHQYYTKLVTSGKNNSEGIWKCLKSLDNKSLSNIPSTMRRGETVLTNSLDIADNFNSLFINAASTSMPENYLVGDEAIRRAKPSLDKLRHYVKKLI